MTLVVRVLTVFPGLIETALSEGMVRIAREKGVLDLKAVNIRDFTSDPHRTTDDAPYGGGAGMVMLAEPIVKAFRSLRPRERGGVFVMSARGQLFDQALAREWSRAPALTLICGRYKGIDERVIDILQAREVSLGDFVLPGGELAAAAMVEAVARLLPGVLGDADSGEEDSHEGSMLGYPVYTRPEEFEGREVPPVLLSGHHAEIAAWRRKERLKATLRRRPELLERAPLDAEDREHLENLRRESTEAS
jgi:tRNA (guanine37-N1)-methyltransferase